MRVAQGKRNAALGSEAIMKIPSLHGLPCRPDGSARQTVKRGLRRAVGYPGRQSLRAFALEWMRAASPPAFAWQQARGRLLVIHDRTALRLLRRRRICEAFLTRNMKHLLGQRPRSSETPRATFARLNASLPARDR